MVAEGLAIYAQTNGIGTLGTDLFAKLMPDSPDNAICVYDETGPVVPGQQDCNIDVFGSQWTVRGAPSFVEDKMMQIHELIPALGNIDLGDVGLVITQILTVPADIGNDNKGREQYSAHYLHLGNLAISANRKNLTTT